MRSQASSEGRRTLTLLGCRARRRLRHDGRVATAVLGRADAHVQPALGLVVTADAGCLSNRFCSVLLCPVHGLDPIPQRVVPSGGAAREAAAGTLGSISAQRLSPQFTVAPKARIWRTLLASILRMSCRLAPAEGLPPSTADITQFVHGIRILLFVRVGVYCRFVNCFRYVVGKPNTELTQDHSGRKAASRNSRGRCGGPPCPERHGCQSGVSRPSL